jgi:hypothetical protein
VQALVVLVEVLGLTTHLPPQARMLVVLAQQIKVQEALLAHTPGLTLVVVAVEQVDLKKRDSRLFQGQALSNINRLEVAVDCVPLCSATGLPGLIMVVVAVVDSTEHPQL